MRLSDFLFVLVFGVLLPCSCSFDRFGKNKPKQEPAVRAKPLPINTDHLPNLEAILEEVGLTRFFSNFIKMGVTDTRLLLRLSSMDFRIMSMEWPGITDAEITLLKETCAVYFQKAIVVAEEPKPNYDERSKIKYGRLYLPGAVQSFEFVTASFGGPTPIGPVALVLAPEPHSYGCNLTLLFAPAELTNKILVVKRGECSFLTKAQGAHAANATGLIVVNNEDRLDSPASGHGIDPNVTDAMVDPLKNLSITSLSNVSWAKLEFAAKFAPDSSLAMAHLVPLKCGPGGICAPVLEEEKAVQAEVSWGTVRIKKQSGGEVRSFEYLTSNFGSRLPSDENIPVVFAEPIDGCSPLDMSKITSFASSTIPPPIFALVVHRGACSFDIKALHAQQAGARLLVVVDVQDSALQRLGGMLPAAGFVGIPSILVTAPCGSFISSSTGPDDLSLSLSFAPDATGADRWIELAFTEWAEDEQEKLIQLEGLSKKFAQSSNPEIVSWLKRRSDEITAAKQSKIPTDEL